MYYLYRLARKCVVMTSLFLVLCSFYRSCVSLSTAGRKLTGPFRHAPSSLLGMSTNPDAVSILFLVHEICRVVALDFRLPGPPEVTNTPLNWEHLKTQGTKPFVPLWAYVSYLCTITSKLRHCLH